MSIGVLSGGGGGNIAPPPKIGKGVANSSRRPTRCSELEIIDQWDVVN